MYPQENQVCSLDQAKKLVKLGVVLDTTWYWIEVCGNWLLKNKWDLSYIEITPKDFKSEIYPAPNVAELGVLLSGYQMVLTPNDGWQIFNPEGFAHGFLSDKCDDLPEAPARTEALIWLLENGHLKSEDLKL